MKSPEILLVSAGIVHPPLAGRLALRQLLTRHLGYRPNRVSGLDRALRLELKQFNVLVLYYHHKGAVLNDRQLSALDSFVSGGGGILAIHSATASYKQNPGYFDILGGRFTGHGPVEPFTIEAPSREPGLWGDINPVNVTDELYFHEITGEIDIRMSANLDGRRIPAVWTRSHGLGRICYIGPGHRTATMKLGSMQNLITRGLEWLIAK